jgi:hypothetical protein
MYDRDVRYFRTATSDAVVYFGGPAMGNGIFAMISLPSSLCKSRALLNPPSIFSIASTGEYCCPPVDAAIAQSLSISKVTYLRPHAWFSLARKRPLVYLNKSSRCIGLPASVQRLTGTGIGNSLPRHVIRSVRDGCADAERLLLLLLLQSLRLMAVSEDANGIATFTPSRRRTTGQEIDSGALRKTGRDGTGRFVNKIRPGEGYSLARARFH